MATKAVFDHILKRLRSDGGVNFASIEEYLATIVLSVLNEAGAVVQHGSVGSGTSTFDASAAAFHVIATTAAITLNDTGWETAKGQSVTVFMTVSNGPLAHTIPGDWNDPDGFFGSLGNGLHIFQLLTKDTGTAKEVFGSNR
ncbi:hypothetical protein KAR91_56465 [Candidatus Pacearchaeota archaeon]|nr:hypothetical protein [Candidatus Pacearchaeota archaeon]